MKNCQLNTDTIFLQSIQFKNFCMDNRTKVYQIQKLAAYPCSGILYACMVLIPVMMVIKLAEKTLLIIFDKKFCLLTCTNPGKS